MFVRTLYPAYDVISRSAGEYTDDVAGSGPAPDTAPLLTPPPAPAPAPVPAPALLDEEEEEEDVAPTR